MRNISKFKAFDSRQTLFLTENLVLLNRLLAIYSPFRNFYKEIESLPEIIYKVIKKIP